MKKIFVLLMLCIINTIQADQLSDAIRASDVDLVNLLLSGNKPTPTQLVKYLDVAEQMVQSRREQLHLSTSRSIESRSIINQTSILTALGCLAGMVGSTILAQHSVMRSMNSGDFFSQREVNDFGKYIGSFYVGLIASVMVACVSEINDRTNNHDNAIIIKELLRDYADAATINFA